MKVGIVASVKSDMIGIPLSYAQYIKDYLGGEIILLSPTSSFHNEIDLLILPGGYDVNPERYGDIPDYSTTPPDLLKEYFDIHHLPLYISEKIPIFGICRGHQSINCQLGGTLIQDMYHETNTKDDPYGAVHPVFDYKNSGKMAFKVNSRHHQAINKLGDGFIPLLHHKDGTIEAMIHQELPIFSLQWHPEDLYEKEASEFITNKINEIMRK